MGENVTSHEHDYTRLSGCARRSRLRARLVHFDHSHPSGLGTPTCASKKDWCHCSVPYWSSVSIIPSVVSMSY
jgi:hypothetical protein